MKVFSVIGRGVLLAAGACLMFACTRPNAAENQSAAAPALANPALATTSTPQNPEDKMPRLTANEAKKLVEEGKAVIIDVRGTDAYKMAHIKDALDIPLNKLESGDYKGLPKDKRIIAYCT